MITRDISRSLINWPPAARYWLLDLFRAGTDAWLARDVKGVECSSIWHSQVARMVVRPHRINMHYLPVPQRGPISQPIALRLSPVLWRHLRYQFMKGALRVSKITVALHYNFRGTRAMALRKSIWAKTPNDRRQIKSKWYYHFSSSGRIFLDADSIRCPILPWKTEAG